MYLRYLPGKCIQTILSFIFLGAWGVIGGEVATSSTPTPAPAVSKESTLTKEQVLSELNAELAKSAKINKRRVYELLETAAKDMEQSYSQDYMLKLLPFFESFNKLDDTHFYVEMFVPVYKQHQKEFKAAIDKVLTPAQKTEFMRKLDIAVTESEEGNG